MSEESLYHIIKVAITLKVSFYSCNSDRKMTVILFSILMSKKMSEESLYHVIKGVITLKVGFYSCNSNRKIAISSFLVNLYTKKQEYFLRTFLPYYQRGCSFKNLHLQFVVVIIR
jgi:hypothetical protein